MANASGVVWQEWSISAQHNATVYLGNQSHVVEYSENNDTTSTINAVTIIAFVPFIHSTCCDLMFFVTAVSNAGETPYPVKVCANGKWSGEPPCYHIHTFSFI